MLPDVNSGANATASDRVTLQHGDSFSLVRLNRPEVRNALSGQMLRQLVDALADADRRSDTGVIVLTGAGSAFCSGDDLEETARADAETFDENIALFQQATRILAESAKPSVAAINGPAMGGGLELTLACDLRVAAEHAVFACPEVAWGLVCTNGSSALLPAYVGYGRARDMVLTGQTYDAAWALTAGLVSEVVPRDQVLDRAIALANELAERSQAVRLTRQLLQDASGDAVARALERETAAVATARRSAAAEASLQTFANRHGREGGNGDHRHTHTR
ncbi:enoyl-CoA hydratase/isomerase family protein [Streptomyces sp. NPDC001292]|uniref:enoyl-CoA hydratase/isomerase family protein n=1 Tax=Streptomyces sp. NPDC001292 TaxID=3364558 RepID=UPI0036B30794